MGEYETQTVHMWPTGDEETYRTCQLLAKSCREQAPVCRQVLDNIWSVEQATRFLLADRLKQFA